MLSKQALGASAIAVAALIIGSLARPAAEAARKAPAEAAGQSCSLYGGGVLDATGQSAAYLFIGERPLCADAGRKQRFCGALQTREGYVAVKTGSEEAAQAAETAQALPDEERRFFLRQHPQHALEQAVAGCGLKLDALRAKLVADTQASLQAGHPDRLADDLEFLRKEAPATVEALWKRECAGRVAAESHGELGYGVAFKGNPVYATYCARTTRVDNAKAPPRFGG